MIQINYKSTKAIYEQIVDGIKKQILNKALSPGDKLPSVRNMSKILTTNPNTVAKAYNELEKQGIIETVKGRGTFIASNYIPSINDKNLKALKILLDKVCLESYFWGVDENTLIKLLKEQYIKIKGGGGDA